MRKTQVIVNMQFYDLVKEELELLEKEIERTIPVDPKEVYQMLLPYIKRGGKRIRPTLAFLCCNAVGGNSQKIIKPAAIIELFHNFTLIHDDIEDNSDMRRGEPTLHKIYGIPVALNSGDAFYTSIWQAILDLELKEKDKISLAKLYGSAFRRVVEGQGIELNWHIKNNFDISENDYLNMISGKTAALLGLSCELGAYLGGANKSNTNSLKSAGEYLGFSFQIKDDVLNLTGDFEKYKKEIGGDISEGKRTLMIIHALKNANEQEKRFIKEILSSHSKNQDDLNRVISIIKDTGAIIYANKKAEEFKSKAFKIINDLKDSQAKNALNQLAEYVINRER